VTGLVPPVMATCNSSTAPMLYNLLVDLHLGPTSVKLLYSRIGAVRLFAYITNLVLMFTLHLKRGNISFLY
jgi:hypothetical protein